MTWKQVSEAVASILVLCPSPVPLTFDIHEKALGIAARYHYQIYDALIIAAAQQARCSTLYSEDMQHGQTIDGLLIRNPFRNV